MVNYDAKQFRMQSFSFSTDGNGQAVLVLSQTPTDDDCLICFCFNTARRVEFVSRAGASVTVQIRKITSKTDDTLGNLPGGVSSASATQNTDGTALSPSSPVSGGSTGVPTAAHNHGLNYVYVHSHDLTDDATLQKAVSEDNIVVTVLYCKTV